MDTKKLRMHLQAAMDCLDGDMGEEAPEVESSGDDEEDSDVPMKSMKMKLSKYKMG